MISAHLFASYQLHLNENISSSFPRRGSKQLRVKTYFNTVIFGWIALVVELGLSFDYSYCNLAKNVSSMNVNKNDISHFLNRLYMQRKLFF